MADVCQGLFCTLTVKLHLNPSERARHGGPHDMVNLIDRGGKVMHRKHEGGCR